MKKNLIPFLITVTIPFSALYVRPSVKYSDDAPIRFDLAAPSLKIVQFADLHLMYGFDKVDCQTFELIKNVVAETKPDLIVFTGDQTLSIAAGARYKELTTFMEELKTPWTFIFGNHDYDYTTSAKILKKVFSLNPEYLYFKEGPELDEDGVGNFAFNYYYEDKPFYNLYFLDSKDELKRKATDSLSEYKYLSTAQVSWYEEKAKVDKENEVYSSVFMHIPLVQFSQAENPQTEDELSHAPGENVSSQSKDTGFFASLVANGVTQAVIVGHNHRNDFVFTHQGIKLIHGRLSGYNAAGQVKRGARVIEIVPSSTPVPNLTTTIINEDLIYET